MLPKNKSVNTNGVGHRNIYAMHNVTKNLWLNLTKHLWWWIFMADIDVLLKQNALIFHHLQIENTLFINIKIIRKLKMMTEEKFCWHFYFKMMKKIRCLIIIEVFDLCVKQKKIWRLCKITSNSQTSLPLQWRKSVLLCLPLMARIVCVD